MNIVKGVADLIRRTSSGPTGESVPGSQLDKLSPPVPRICFSEVGKEAILYTLWERYDRENDKVEKRKSFHVFLKHFLTTYKSWEPVDSGQLSDNTSSTEQPREPSIQCDPTIMGCSVGHPAEVILAFSQELVQLTALVTELSVNTPQSAKNILEHSSGSEISEGICLLEALSIATRSIHNCRVFGYSGGVQKLTALMKGSVVQLKTISGAVSADESLSALSVEKIKRLQQILTLVVSIVCNFIGLTTDGNEMAKLHGNFSHSYFPRSFAFLFKAAVKTEAPLSELRLQWRQRAVVSVMEAGGLNWLVELLRVIRRLSVKDQWSDVILQYLTLRTLQSALAGNSRGQNHFKSIGGLEVLLDGLGLPSDNALKLDNLPGTNDNRDGNPLLCLLELHVLSFDVLREAVFGNVNNLQFLSESGRVHKFANSFCSPVFMLQDHKVLEKLFPSEEKNEVCTYDRQNENNAGDYPAESSVPFSSTPFHSQSWNDYVSNLSRVLCSFLYIAEDNKSHVQAAVSRAALSVSPVYCELSVKWILRVLGTVFPCIKAFSEQNQLPVHLRVFVNKLHQTVLNTFRKILASTPLLLEVFRDEGIWDLIFSENFFYFGPALDESSEGYSLGNEDSCGSLPSSSSCNDHAMMGSGIESLQMNILSLTELAATSGGSTHNLPEVRFLVDALEESVCNARLANILAKTLLRILQFSAERTVASLTAIDAIPRVLKVICLQAQESKKSEGIYQSVKVSEAVVSSRGQSWQRCLDTSFSLFTQLSKTDDGMKSTLGSSSCIDCLFELFWVEKLRNHVLKHVLDLMKIVPSSEEDQKAKLYLCSKYLETFTQVKEREKSFAKLSIDLLAGMRDMIRSNQVDLFRDGECFLHVVSLLNGNLETDMGEELVLNVLQTLTCLLASNDVSKASFRALVGTGYQTLQSLLLDFCHWRPTEGLLNALLDMLVDGRFDVKANNIIKNEDVVVLYLSVLHKSSEFLCHHGLNLFQILLRDSLSNRASCVRAGMLSFLLDWFSQEKNDSIVVKIAQLVQVIGGHSISGKDIRKIFALLRSEKVGARQQYCSLLLTSVLSMLNEKGPTAFFDLNGSDSGIKIRTPIQWPQNKGFSFSCWLRVESFPRGGTMSLFSFLTENGRGCAAVLSNDRLIVESSNLKRQSVQLQLNLMRKRWHFLCITHSIGRAFSGGSLLKCYVDGKLVSSERCSYAKVNELLTQCTIGAKASRTVHEEDSTPDCRDSFAFHGQIGPVYMFTDAISPEVIQRICFLGPSYMYSFVDNEDASSSSSQLPSGLLDLKDGLASKVLFGLNAQASDGKILLNASAISNHVLDRNSFEAIILPGTQLCSRRLLQQIIYCVGGVSVFFPLIAQDRYENEESGELVDALLIPVTKERLTAEVIELIASVLDENVANQQQMLLLSGFSVLGFLLQSLPPQQLNLATLSAMKHLFNVIASCGLAEQLVGDAISHVFLNPLVWVYASYSVQRELYMFLIQQFDNDLRLLSSHCRLPRTLDIIRQYYWDVKSKFAIGSKPLLHPVTRKIIGERPNQDEIRKIRLLLLGLGEMSLRQNIVPGDMKALVAFFETSQDMACIEDVLHMAIRAISQKSLLASFLDQINTVGGCHIFVNLLQREFESIRLLSLQFLGRLLVGSPSEKKGSRFFNLAVGRSRPLSEISRSVRMQPIISAISERLFRFPQTENLCATLFDVLLGGASPKQVLQKQSQAEKQRSRGSSSHFLLPEMLALIFRFLSECNEPLSRLRILRDLTDLLDSSPSNIEALMEHGWNAWLAAVVKLDGLSNRVPNSGNRADNQTNEYILVKNLFCVVLVYHVLSVKGGWQQLEETVNFLSMHSVEGAISYQHLLRDIFDDLIQKLVDLSSEDNIFVSQPCRDNTLYLLKLVDEMLISELDNKLPFPASGSDFSLVSLDLDSYKEFSFALQEVLQGESKDQLSRNSQAFKHPCADEDTSDNWWSLYDNLWVLICAINGKGPNKASSKPATSPGPSFGQRARGLVESLNIPAAEMAAVVVSGGISNALGTKPSKSVDKAMLLRGERCPRIVFRLVILYQCQSSLERASRCVQQFVSLLPSLLVADDEQSKTRLQLFIWALLSVRSRYGVLDDGARFHVISRLIRETVHCGKSVLATSMASRDDSPDSGSNSKETGTIESLIQKDRVLSAVAEEAKYMKALKNDRSKQVQQLQKRIDEALAAESSSRRAFEDEIQSSLITIVSSDESRRAGFQLIQEEQQQNIAEKWMHVFRTLIDERGPWSANPFPNTALRHWKLDKTEDRWRRRQKLRQNYHFDEKLCYPPRTAPPEETSLPKNDTKYGFVGHIPEQMKRLLLKGVRRITDEGISDQGDGENELDVHNSDSDDVQIEQQSQRDKESNDDKDVVQEKMDSATSTGTEANEVLLSVPCVLVTPKRKLAGHLAIMKTALHFSGEYIVDGTGGSSVFKNLNASTPDQSKSDNKQKLPKWALQLEMESEKGLSADSTEAVSENMHKEHLKHLKRHRRWNIDKIKAVHWTRYLLRYTAAEIFFSDSVAPIFFNFASTKEAKEIGTLIVTIRNELLFPKGSTKDKSGVISFVDRRVALEMAESARERWRRRDISNFQYLMILNTLSGRSYNDITQYPVFPWVLADYSSEVLDFNKSSTFRDLSKPVGALDSKRFEAFEDRYHNFCDPDIPSFYYGSHYSSMGIVLYYLLRLEPFTALHRSLQGGKFDHADRLFQSVESTYRNCLSNTSDVKELIPEFFYMPEFLMNSNSYHFGVKQDGVPLGDVGLPPWAKGSPEEFVSKNREALESEYVSSNLHHWIDLVFGYKQRGKPAVEAANVFYYLTYEGAVDLDSMEDDLQRSAIEDQIANFGQTPIQIFRKKHPRRGPPIPIAHPLYFAPSSINLTSVALIANNPPSAVLYVGLLDSNIVLVSQGLTLSVKMWLTTQLQSGGNFTFSGSQDPFFGIGADFLSPRKIGSPLAGNAESGAQYFTTVQIAAENFLITCGNWENSFQVISLSDGRMVQSIRQHKDVVSCVAATSDGSILATGSYDTTVMVWEINRARAPEKRARNSQLDITRKESVISETPFHILCGHDDIITCLYVSVELDIVISGSKDGTCIFHTLREGRYVRSLRHPSGCALAKLVASPHGKIVFYADDDLSLNLFSINGKHLASCESNGRLNCLELSSCGEFLACAGDQGQIVVRSMSSLDVIQRYNGVGKIITSLRVTPEECFLAGTKDGSLLVYSIENPQLRKGHPRNAKLKSSAVG